MKRFKTYLLRKGGTIMFSNNIALPGFRMDLEGLAELGSTAHRNYAKTLFPGFCLRNRQIHSCWLIAPPERRKSKCH